MVTMDVSLVGIYTWLLYVNCVHLLNMLSKLSLLDSIISGN